MIKNLREIEIKVKAMERKVKKTMGGKRII